MNIIKTPGGDKKRDEGKTYTKEDIWIIGQRFVIGFLVFVIVLLLTTKATDQFVSEFSFAATISSIILSILAIFMSINGESKTQSIRTKIENEADDISNATDYMQRVISELEKKVDSIKKDTNVIGNMLSNKGPSNAAITSAPENVINPEIAVLHSDDITGDDYILSIDDRGK